MFEDCVSGTIVPEDRLYPTRTVVTIVASIVIRWALRLLLYNRDIIYLWELPMLFTDLLAIASLISGRRAPLRTARLVRPASALIVVLLVIATILLFLHMIPQMTYGFFLVVFVLPVMALWIIQWVLMLLASTDKLDHTET